MKFEEILIEYCAPTLAGVKAANLFRISPRWEHSFLSQYRNCKAKLAEYGLSLVILKRCPRTHSYLFYLYREKELCSLLEKWENREFLTSLGYSEGEDTWDYLKQIMVRMCLQEEFPHEIGIFLDYPLEDVKGFMEHKGRECNGTGCWKSYSDPAKAKQCFERYRKCKQVLKHQYASGVQITKLVVAS